MIRLVNERTPYIIELHDELTAEEITEMSEILLGMPEIISAQYISKEEGLKIMENHIGKEFLTGDNPLMSIFKLKLKDEVIEKGKVDELTVYLNTFEWVSDCYFEKDSVEDLRNNLKSFNSVLLFIAMIFITISFILIYNNLKFILHADRFQIKTMELIGASPAFIKMPYMKLSIKIGLFSGLFAILLILSILLYLNSKYGIAATFMDYGLTAIVLLFLLLISTLSPPLFINFLVEKYLKMTDRERYS
jgi:cell division transport system permease protein